MGEINSVMVSGDRHLRQTQKTSPPCIECACHGGHRCRECRHEITELRCITSMGLCPQCKRWNYGF